MPYRRRMFRRRRPYRAAPFRRRRFFRRSRFVKVHRPEVKKFDINVTDAGIEGAGTIQHITPIAAGTGVTERIGNACYAKYLSAKFLVTNRASAGNTGLNVFHRIIIFQDTSNGTSTPTVAGATDGVLQSATVNSNYNDGTVGRYKIYMDKMYALNSYANTFSLAGGTGDSEPEVQNKAWRVYKRIWGKNSKMTWSGAAGADLQINPFFILSLSDIDEGGTMNMNFRLGFTDQ